MWPTPWPDEAHFADISLTLLTEGRLATDLFRFSFPALQEHAYWTPPLYYLALAVWFIVGASLWWQRTFSAVCAIFALAAIWRLSTEEENHRAMFAVAFLCVDVAFVRSALMGRMDMLCLALGLWSVVLARGSRPGGAGLLAGLAVCTHPMGLAAAFGAFLWSPTVRFVGWSLLPISLWFVWVVTGDPGAFLEQWNLQMERKANYRLMDVWWRFLTQYRPMLAVPVFLWTCGIIGCWKSRDFRWLAWFSATLILAFLGGEIWYPLYLTPVVVMAVRMRDRFSDLALIIAGFLSLTSILNQIYHTPKGDPLPEEIGPEAIVEIRYIPDQYWEIKARGAKPVYPSPFSEIETPSRAAQPRADAILEHADAPSGER